MAEYFTLDFLWRFLRIVAIDIVLAGDNAVVIAMAVRSLPERQRRQGILWGALAAVGMRVAITIVAVQLLAIPYLSAVGGALVLWIAAKLLAQEPPEEPPDTGRRQEKTEREIRPGHRPGPITLPRAAPGPSRSRPCRLPVPRWPASGAT